MRAAGWEVRSRLARPAFEVPDDLSELDDPLPAVDLDVLLADPALDLAVVDGTRHGAVLPRLRRAGLLVLLAGPAPLDPELLRATRAAADLPEAGVALVRRGEPWARTVARALPLAGPVAQVTVRGWPRGEAAAAELADLTALWCGDVVAACAAPAALPAAALDDGLPVASALLTVQGTTVLVSHDGPLRVRLSGQAGRLEAEPAGVRWTGGDPLPLPLDDEPGLVRSARLLHRAVGGGDLEHADPPLPGLSDLLVLAEVVAALRASAASGGWVEVG